jgi:shikimate dehydrogenase
MRTFGLIGHPLTHSFSKRYFTEKFEREGIADCRYELFPLPSISALPALLEIEVGLCGLNVTIPYKQQVIPYLHGMDEVVRGTGACNCIRVEDGKLHGHNTDVTGFELSLRELLRPVHDRALVLGTGGAAKAVHFVLKKIGIPFREVSRNATRDVLSYAHLTGDIVHSHRLIINTTPLGMYPDIAACPDIPYEALGKDHYLFDLVYNPARTLFLQKGEERGATIANGADMLRIQAEESWKIWNASWTH